MLLVWEPGCIFLVTLHISQFNSPRERMTAWLLKEGTPQCEPQVPTVVIANDNNPDNVEFI